MRHSFWAEYLCFTSQLSLPTSWVISRLINKTQQPFSEIIIYNFPVFFLSFLLPDNFSCIFWHLQRFCHEKKCFLKLLFCLVEIWADNKIFCYYYLIKISFFTLYFLSLAYNWKHKATNIQKKEVTNSSETIRNSKPWPSLKSAIKLWTKMLVETNIILFGFFLKQKVKQIFQISWAIGIFSRF